MPFPTASVLRRAGARAAWAAGFACLATLAAETKPSGPWQPGAGFRWAPLPAPPPGQDGFTRLDAGRTGVAFTNQLAIARITENQILLNGSGVAAGDVDGDGWCDLFFAGLEGGSTLFRNGGGWRFEDVTAPAGVACPGQFTTGAVFADVDGDGDPDLLVNSVGGGTRLFQNDGGGRFREAADSGLRRQGCATTSALADIDGDGDLDLYVGFYRTTTVRSTGLEFVRVGGQRQLKPEDREGYALTPEGRLVEIPEPDALYLNDGRGRFTELAWTDGRFLDEDGRPLRAAPRDWTLTAMFRDLNQDGRPDLYVCGDFESPDRVWLNLGGGRFRASPRLAFRTTSTFSMAVDVADVDRDGRDDILVTDMIAPDHLQRMVETGAFDARPYRPGLFDDRPQEIRNTLQWNRGDGTYAEAAFYAGIEASGWTWMPAFLDVDLDGYEDVLVTTGHSYNTQDLDAEARIAAMGPFPRGRVGQKVLLYPPLAQPKQAYRNRGDLRFSAAGDVWRFDDIGVAQGLALADLDNDGDLDVAVNHLNAAAGLYRNDTTAPRLAVRLVGVAANRQGIGARLECLGGPVPQSQEVVAGGRYVSGADPLRVFAAGTATNALRLEVAWPGGRRSIVAGVPANSVVEVMEPSATATNAPRAMPEVRPWFEDVSDRLNHVHHETLFNDFERQPLLPNRLSQPGPGVCWADLDGDGWDDLVIGTGAGGRLGVFRNDQRGGFEPLNIPPWNQTWPRDTAGLVAWPQADGRTVILAAFSNYEDGRTNGAAVVALRSGTAAPAVILPDQPWSPGPLALADVDADGDLDLFVGGRVIPGRYPEPADSLLLRNDGGNFVEAQRFAAVGLVAGALFTDLTGDGAPDLALACEWGPLTIFRNDRGRLAPWDPTVESVVFPVPTAARLARLAGWWTGIASGDFDGDGRMDLVAANWGLNSRYRARLAEPRRLYFGDFNGQNGVDVVEAFLEAGIRPVPDRDFMSLSEGLPFIRERFATHRAYGGTTVPELLGSRFANARFVEAGVLESMIFLNRGESFEARPLPREAQLAPAFAAVVTDADGDGAEDIFLAQNFFATQPFAARADAGRGLWLKGDGRGGFQALSATDSGVALYGEQRGAGCADFDRDGRIDFVVGQNGSAAGLFRNQSAKPGWRVVLAGPPGNPKAVAARVRLEWGDRPGPVREIQSGSGYWSGNGMEIIWAAGVSPTAVRVDWPGGSRSRTVWPGVATEVRVQSPR